MQQFPCYSSFRPSVINVTGGYHYTIVMIFIKKIEINENVLTPSRGSIQTYRMMLKLALTNIIINLHVLIMYSTASL